MKAIINLDDVPDWQIGQFVNVYFPDTMMKTGICEAEENDEQDDGLKHYDDGSVDV